VRICWIDNAQMHALDLALRSWVEAQASHLQTSAEVTTARSRLVDVLLSLRTIHPAAVLHDCDDDDDNETPIRLDSTSLGTL